GQAAHFQMQAVPPALLAAATAVEVDHDLVVAKLQAGDLHIVAGADGRPVAGHSTGELLAVHGLADVEPRTFLGSRERLDGFGELPGDRADQTEVGGVLKRGALGARGTGCLLVGRRTAGKQGDLFSRWKGGYSSGRRAETLNARHAGVGQENRED